MSFPSTSVFSEDGIQLRPCRLVIPQTEARFRQHGTAQEEHPGTGLEPDIVGCFAVPSGAGKIQRLDMQHGDIRRDTIGGQRVGIFFGLRQRRHSPALHQPPVAKVQKCGGRNRAVERKQEYVAGLLPQFPGMGRGDTAIAVVRTQIFQHTFDPVAPEQQPGVARFADDLDRVTTDVARLLRLQPLS